MKLKTTKNAVNWHIRNKTFVRSVLGGMDIQEAYDFAMCRLHRAEGIDLPWGEPHKALLEMLKHYEPKESVAKVEKPKPKAPSEDFTYDTKPVWKRTVDGLVFADFLDGNGIMKTNTRALQDGDKTWTKYDTGAFRYVFKQDRVLLESNYHGSLRYFKLSDAQSKKLREYYGENGERWEE